MDSAASWLPAPLAARERLWWIADGPPVLWAAPRLKSLLAFSADEKLLEAAVAALVASVARRSQARGRLCCARKIVVEHFNGRDVLATPAASWLRAPASCAFPTASASMRARSKATSPKKEGPLRLSPTRRPCDFRLRSP